MQTECDDDLANGVTYILGRVINRCLLPDAVPLDRCEWDSLRDQLDDWRTSLSSSFDPILTPHLLAIAAFRVCGRRQAGTIRISPIYVIPLVY
jgi:hypothetical protein